MSMVLKYIAVITLCGVLAAGIRLGAQDRQAPTSPPNYQVSTLALLDGTAGAANGINDRGWVTGGDNQQGDLTSMATLWVNGSLTRLGTLGGPNSIVQWPVKANNGVIVGISELADLDPVGENFSCWPFFAASTPTGRICKGFRWQNQHMTALPPFPGGYSSYATSVNNSGQVVGWAENGVADPTCNPSYQILQFRAALWQPDGTMQELPPLPGDSTSAATAINDLGQVVGISGDCGVAVGSVSARHAVLWQNGVPMDLGNIGGDAWNTPTRITNGGTIIGFANTQPGVARTFQAFVWTPATGMKSLGTLPGDFRSEALGINEKGQIVGLSRGNPPSAPFKIRAFLWENGKMTDMNSLTGGSPYLLFAGDIDQQAHIVGEALDLSTGDAPAFIAAPLPPGAAISGAAPTVTQRRSLPDNILRQIERKGLASDE